MSVDRRTFQLHLILTSASVSVAFAVVIALAIFVPLAVQLQRTDLDPEAMGGVARFALDLHASFWPVVLVCMIGSVVSGMLLYRRMTRPLIRFVRVFEAVARGDEPRPLRIRDHDYLSAEADALNHMVERVVERGAARRRIARDLQRIADDLEAAVPIDIEAAELLRELRHAAEKLG